MATATSSIEDFMSDREENHDLLRLALERRLRSRVRFQPDARGCRARGGGRGLLGRGLAACRARPFPGECDFGGPAILCPRCTAGLAETAPALRSEHGAVHIASSHPNWHASHASATAARWNHEYQMQATDLDRTWTSGGGELMSLSSAEQKIDIIGSWRYRFDPLRPRTAGRCTPPGPTQLHDRHSKPAEH